MSALGALGSRPNAFAWQGTCSVAATSLDAPLPGASCAAHYEPLNGLDSGCALLLLAFLIFLILLRPQLGPSSAPTPREFSLSPASASVQALPLGPPGRHP